MPLAALLLNAPFVFTPIETSWHCCLLRSNRQGLSLSIFGLLKS